MTQREFSQFVTQYEKLVFTICYQFVKDYHEAQNLSQETFLSAYRHIDSYQGDNYKPWIARIATNKAKDYLNSAYSRRVMLASSEETDLYAVSPVNGNVGFRREGAQYTFDVKLPEGKPTKVTFHSEKYKTWVVVDGKKIEGNPVREHYAKTCKFFTLAKPETK